MAVFGLFPDLTDSGNDRSASCTHINTAISSEHLGGGTGCKPLASAYASGVTVRSMRRLVLVGAVLSVLGSPAAWGRRGSTAPRPAPVSEAPPADLSGVQAALDRHDLPTAERQLVATYRRTRAAEALYLLGTMARERNDLLAAYDYWQRYVGDPAIDASTPHAQEAQKFLDQGHGPAGELQVVGEAGALVLVDGRLAGALPFSQPLLLSIGTHQVRVEVQRKALSVQLQIADGRGTEVRFIPDYDALLVSVPPAVIILPEWTGPAPAVQRRLMQEARQAVRRSNHAIYDTATALSHAPQYKACLHEPGCRMKLAAASEIDFVLSLQGRAPASGNGAWSFTAELQGPPIVVPAGAARRDCSSCSVEQAAVQLAALLEELVQKGGGRGRSLLQVSSQPDGALISLGSLVLGKTPATLPLWVGEYELTLALPGEPPTSVHARVNEGPTVLPLVQLDRAAPQAAGPAPVAMPARKRPLWRLIVGGIALSGGAILIGNGVSAALVDGHCVEDAAPMAGPQLDCGPSGYYGTGSVAAGFLGAGSALALGGVLLLAIPGRKSP